MQEVRRPFEMELPESIHRLETAFTSSGFQLFVVGGAVRDAVLGVTPKDFDLATNATPSQVSNIILSMLPGWTTDLTGEAFGVIRARQIGKTELSQAYWAELREELNVLCEHEIATFREDLSAGRHPEVRFATIVEDVQRRDLTINALFYDIQRHEIVDLVGGLQDLELGFVRMVGRPEDRLAEDRLRIMRAIRFAVRFGYPLAEATERAILSDNSLEGISPERIRDEFLRALASAQDVRVFLGLMDYYNMWTQVFPGLRVNTKDVSERDPAVCLALLLAENGIEDVARALNRLKYSDHEVKQVTFLMRYSELSFNNAFKLRKLADATRVTREQMFAYGFCTGLPHPGLAAAFWEYRPTVKGDDLLAQGYSGRALGEELERRETQLFVSLAKELST